MIIEILKKQSFDKYQEKISKTNEVNLKKNNVKVKNCNKTNKKEKNINISLTRENTNVFKAAFIVYIRLE